MGYTHSWYRPRELEREKFADAVEDCRKVCEASMIPLRGVEGAAEPVFRDFIVAFNGGCEPLIVQCVCDARSPERPSRAKPGAWFGFCKTEHLPYDLCVQAALIVFQHHLGAGFLVSSDGDSAAWGRARELCQRVLGYGESFSLASVLFLSCGAMNRRRSAGGSKRLRLPPGAGLRDERGVVTRAIAAL